ncbi:MAG: hypothetical protein MUC92_08665 [Fimbriimonadaceae bacterium]|jgi:hypothetical protein|nr:hypothetical protein [Fimbriimonadaceae bacterium]
MSFALRPFRPVCFLSVVALTIGAVAEVERWTVQSIPKTSLSLELPYPLTPESEEETPPEWGSKIRTYTAEDDHLMVSVSVIEVKAGRKMAAEGLKAALEVDIANVRGKANDLKLAGPDVTKIDGQDAATMTLTHEMEGSKLILHRIMISHKNQVFLIDGMELPGSPSAKQSWARIRQSIKVSKKD